MGETKNEILARLKTIESKLDTMMQRMNALNPAEDRTMIDIAMAMKVTGLARPTIYNFTAQRKIPHYKKGKHLYFKRKELEEWIEKGRRKTADEIRADARRR